MDKFKRVVRRTHLLLLLLYVCAALSSCSSSASATEIFFKNPDGKTSPRIQVEIADSEKKRRFGLMYRKEMPEREGMLFIFPDERERNFWMKNTYIGLNIIYIDSKRRVVSVRTAKAFSEKRVPSGKPAKYAVEINAGLAEKWGIVSGSVMELTESLAEPLS